MQEEQAEPMVVEDVWRVPALREGYEPVTIRTTHGEVECRYYASPGSHRCAVFVGGAGGGFDTPVRGELKQLILHPTARHGLDQAADELPGLLAEWIRTSLP